MTMFGVPLTSRLLWSASAAAGTAALVIAALAAAGGPDRANAAPTASLICDTNSAVFGEPVTCTVEGDDAVIVNWGDGTATKGPGSHTASPAAVGAVEIKVTDGDTVLASHVVDITPDIHIECEYGLPLPVYELADGPNASGEPYDYVYVDEYGAKIFPGDDAYPANLTEMLELERAIVERAPIVGLCDARSAAVDALAGSVTWTVESPWYEPYTTKSRKITPGTPAHWDGVQPIDVTVTVDVDGYEASERIGVYFGGCG